MQFICGGVTPQKSGFVQPTFMDRALVSIIEQIEILKKKKPGVVTVFIAGGTASGKTTLAEKLREYYGNEATLISMDDFYIGRAYSEAHGYNFDQPESLDILRLSENLKELQGGWTANVPIYSFKDDGGKRIGYKEVASSKIIIVEGLFALHETLFPYGDFKVFVKTDSHGRGFRRLFRDVKRTVWRPEDIFGYFLEIVEPMHGIYIDPQEKNADIMIDNPYDPKVELPLTGVCSLEMQIKVIDGPFSDEILRKAGVQRLSHVMHEDSYFIIPCENDHKKETIRIRRQGDLLTFTYKGPKIDGETTRTKNKFEFIIPSDTKKRIEAYLILEKKFCTTRDLYILDGVVFSTDCVSWNGQEHYFLEARNVEGEQLEAFLKKLELENAPRTNESYYELFN